MKPRVRWYKRWKWWLLGALVAVLGVTVVAPFIFIHVIEGTPPPPLSLSVSSQTPTVAGTSSSATSSASPAGFAGTYKIASGSEVEYRVAETLFAQSTTAVGTSSTVSGNLTTEGATITAAKFTVPLATVHSDQSQRDDQFDNRIMDVADFPNAVFTLTQPISLGSVPATNTIVNEQATGNLTMHGVTKSVTFTLQLEYTGTSLKVSGAVPITFADWNIQNPSGGPAQVGDNGTLGFLLNLAI